MINIIFIHGINYQTTGYSNWLFQNILCQYEKILKKKGSGLTKEAIARYIKA